MTVAVPPVVSASLAVLRGLEAGIRERWPRREFLRAADAARAPLYEAACDHYGDPWFAKLLYLKATNYLVARHHLACRHVHLASRPVTLMVDPSNACQLACPGCVHSENTEFTAQMSWPAATLRQPTFDALLRETGPFALNAVLYNYGEPLLNKRFPDFVEAAHGFGLSVHLSTNFSLRFDVERFVEAGPDHVILSIDGASQETYARFRKGGDFALVMENVRRAVAEKRRRGTTRPVLTWRFLTFEHNVHEVDRALEMAAELGVDQIRIGTPFDVSRDDPGVRVAQSERRGVHTLVEQPTRPDPLPRMLVRKHDAVDQRFEEGWLARGLLLPPEPARPDAPACVWLYYNMTADAAGRVMPCCIAPSQRKRLVFGQITEQDPLPFNARDFVLSRLAFADRALYQAENGRDPAPWCAHCPKQPPLTHDPANGAHDLYLLDDANALLGGAGPFWWRLADWK